MLERLRPQRHADADLARPLGHRDEHDVHHADAADEQRQEGDADHHHVEAAGDLVVEPEQGLVGHRREVVVLVRAQPAPRAQHGADLVDGGAHLLGRARHGVEQDLVALEERRAVAGEELAQAGVRDEHDLVHVHAQELAARLELPDDLERLVADVDRLAHRALVREQRRQRLATQQRHVGAMVHLELGEEAALGHVVAVRLLVGLVRSQHERGLRRQLPVADRGLLLDEVERRDRAHRRALGEDRVAVPEREGAAIAQGVGQLADDHLRAPLADVDRVRAERLDLVRHRLVESLDQGDHGDDGGDADDHAQHGQQGAQLVRLERLPRHEQDLAQQARAGRLHSGKVSHGSSYSWRSATIGSRRAARAAG